MVNYLKCIVGTFHVPCQFENLLMGRGGGPENVTTFGVLSILTLNVIQPRMRLGTRLRSYMTTFHPSDLTRTDKILPGPVLGIFIWLRMPGREFQHFTVFLDVKITPWKMPLLEIHFLCEISLISSSISTKNEPLTPRIDYVMRF